MPRMKVRGGRRSVLSKSTRGASFMCVIMCTQRSLNWGLAFINSDWERIVTAQGDLAIAVWLFAISQGCWIYSLL